MAEKDLETILGIKFFEEGEKYLKFDPNYRREVARIVGVMQGDLIREGAQRGQMVCLRVEEFVGNKYNFDYDPSTALELAHAFGASTVAELLGKQIFLYYVSKRLVGYSKLQGSARVIW